MKSGALRLLLCAALIFAAIPAALAGTFRPTALFRDDFADTSKLDAVDTLTAQGGYLQVPAEVAWLQDTFADFYPGAGTGVDLYARPGSVALARFSTDRRVNDVPAGPQVEVAAAYATYIQGLEDVPYLYAAWADGRGGDLDIYFARSTDGGYTWSAGRKLNLLDDAGDQRAPAIAASGGYVHAAWEDDAGVHYARSLDYGSTWVNDVLLAAGAAAPAIAATHAEAQPLVYLVYVAAETPGDPDLYARRSATGGASWDAPEDVAADEPAGAAQRAPRLLLPTGLDAPWVAWEDDRGGDWDAYAGRRGGGAWPNQRVDSGPAGSTQRGPALFYPAGAAPLHALWADDRGGSSDLYAALYDTDTLTWLELGPVTSGMEVGPPAAAVFFTHAWAAWTAGAGATIQAGRHDGAAWETPRTVPDHRPGTAHSAPAIARAGLDGSVTAVLWSDDRAGDGDVYAATTDGAYVVTGVYTSPVHEFGDLAAWGPITWTGSFLDHVAVETRSGDTPAPGPDWSPWAAASSGGTVPAPPARYLQYRAHLARTAAADTPELASVLVRAAPRGGTAVALPAGRCVAAWGEFTGEGYAPSGTTMTLSVLDLTGTVLYGGVVTPFDLSAIPAAQHGRLRLHVAMARTPADTPLLNWWQVTWEEGRTHAAFSFAPPIVYTPTVVAFTNLSTGTVAPLTYTWDFGGNLPLTGGTGARSAPSPGGGITHTFAAPGAYTVTLRAAGECGIDTAAAALTVLPAPLVPPTAAFGHGPLCAGAAVSFTNESADAIWWRWAFGDGQESALLHPTHPYSASGDYTVTLAVTNTRGSGRAVERLPVRPAPTAAFSWTAELLTAAFSATVSGDPALRWDFGDGGTSTLPRPVHTYPASGLYTVTLTAENACGAAAAAARAAVYCAPAQALGMAWTPLVPAPGQTASWTAQVTGSAPLTLTWTFGDGGTGQGASAAHAYAAPGAYTVTLRAENACGQGTAAAVVNVAAPVYRAFFPLVYARDYYPGDAYEDDDTPARARLLPLDLPQRHDFAPAGDEDWVYLHLTDGVAYYFATYDLAGGADTVLALYAAGQAEPLAQNDDCTGQTLASCLTVTPPASGRYELRVTNIAGLWGAGVGYTLAGRMQ